MAHHRPHPAEPDLEDLARLAEPPRPWEPGEALFWDDPHIATQMLRAHLDPGIEAASAPPDVIDARVAWLAGRLELRPGDALVDLGCGPGLYTRRFAGRGLRVTGIDLSPSSIEYARGNDPVSTYRCENYLALEDDSTYAVAALIFGDYCVLDDGSRERLLRNVRRALRPDGRFVLDVSTKRLHDRHNCGDGWSVHPDGGFWRAGPHLVLMRHFPYPEQDLSLDQYVVAEGDGTVTVYRNWFRYFTAATITRELEAGGFAVEDLYGDLAGSPFDPEGDWIGIVARRV